MPHHYGDPEAVATSPTVPAAGGSLAQNLIARYGGGSSGGNSAAQDAYYSARAQEILNNLSLQGDALDEEIRRNAVIEGFERDRLDVQRENIRVQEAAGIRADQIAADRLLEQTAARLDANERHRETLVAQAQRLQTQLAHQAQQLEAQLGFQASESALGRQFQAQMNRFARVGQAIEYIEQASQFRQTERRRLAETVGTLLQNPGDVGAVGAVLEGLQPGALGTAIGTGQDLRTDLSLSPVAATLAAQDALDHMDPRIAGLLEQLLAPVPDVGISQVPQIGAPQGQAPTAVDPVAAADAATTTYRGTGVVAGGIEPGGVKYVRAAAATDGDTDVTPGGAITYPDADAGVTPGGAEPTGDLVELPTGVPEFVVVEGDRLAGIPRRTRVRSRRVIDQSGVPVEELDPILAGLV